MRQPSTEPRIALLQNAFFAGARLESTAVEQIAAALQERRFAKGETIFRQGDSATDMFFVTRGRVGIFQRVGDSRVLLAELEPGGYFGEIALLDGGERSADAEALEDVELLALDDPTFDDLVDRVPRLALHFLRATGRRLRAVNRQVAAPQPAPEGGPPSVADPMRDRYPYPIASVYRSMGVIQDPKLRLERLLDLLEVGIRYLGNAAVATYLKQHERSSELVDDALVQSLVRVTLGQWLGLVREVLQLFDDDPERLWIPELYSAVFARPGRPSPGMRALDELVKARNAIRHGAGGALGEREATSLVERLEPTMRTALGSMSFAADYPLVWLERMDFARGSFVYRYQRCMGSHSDFPSESVTLREPCETGQLHLLHRDRGSLAPLFPFVTLEPCSVCTLRDVFFLIERSGDALQFAEFARGHHLATTAPTEALAQIASDARRRLHDAERAKPG